MKGKGGGSHRGSWGKGMCGREYGGGGWGRRGVFGVLEGRGRS